MTWPSTAAPNLADYRSFLLSVVGLEEGGVNPAAGGAAAAGSATTLTDPGQSWAANQFAGYTLYDQTQNATAVVSSNTATQLTFPAISGAVAAGDVYVVVQPVVAASLVAALATVNLAIATLDAYTYNDAVYNLAAHGVIASAPDQQDQTYFGDLRDDFKMVDPPYGAVASTSSAGHSVALMNPEWMRAMTMADLSTIKTPYGRAYMSIAQTYGSNIWVRV